MNKNLKLFHKEALKLHLPIEYFPEVNYLRIKLGKKFYYFNKSKNPVNEGAGVFAAWNKDTCCYLLSKAGFPIPKSVTISEEAFLTKPLPELLQDLNYPLVTKPVSGWARGHGVLCNIKNETILRHNLESFFKKFPIAKIEEFQKRLKEYRVTILNKKVIGVVQRIGAHITGDGKHSIKALVELDNVKREKIGETLTYSIFKFDEESEICLKEQGLTIDSIPPKGATVRLAYTANTGRGGEVVSLGKRIHPTNATILGAVPSALFVDYLGLDVLCEDIENPFTAEKWWIIEANIYPDLTIHEIPHLGKRAPIASKLLMQIIRKHPWTYLRHLCFKSKLAIYFKGILLALMILAGSLFIHKVI